MIKENNKLEKTHTISYQFICKCALDKFYALLKRHRLKLAMDYSLTRKNSILWGASATDRERSLPQTTRARISNYVSGGQCHIIHIIILRRFTWPSLAYMCTKMTLKITFILFIIISFIHFTIQNEIFTTSTTRLTCWLAC